MTVSKDELEETVEAQGQVKVLRTVAPVTKESGMADAKMDRLEEKHAMMAKEPMGMQAGEGLVAAVGRTWVAVASKD